MPEPAFQMILHVVPSFNLAATMSFVDPFRAANYLSGDARFSWTITSLDGGPVTASNGVPVMAQKLDPRAPAPGMAVVSSSWTPEAAYGEPLASVLRRWSRFGVSLAGLDTGAFVLAQAGLLKGHRATVHYEHIDAFAETFPETEVSEDLYVIDRNRMTAAGGSACADLALQILRAMAGTPLANAASRYVFHERLRPEGTRQLPEDAEPLGARAPAALRRAIQHMEDNLEEAVAIPEIAGKAGLSQRQLERLFLVHVGRSPARYYSDIRLDRARGLVVQTEMPVREIALACGFGSLEHFSRAYRARFGRSARTDRVAGRIPFEFRAWPMHEEGAKR